jgi:hypothetical protein
MYVPSLNLINQPFLIPTGLLLCVTNFKLSKTIKLGNSSLDLLVQMLFLVNGFSVKNFLSDGHSIVIKLVGSVVVFLNNMVLITMKLSLL